MTGWVYTENSAKQRRCPANTLTRNRRIKPLKKRVLSLLLEYYAALGENTFYQFSEGAFTSSAGYLLSVQLYETTYQGEQVLGVFVSGMQTVTVGGLPRAAVVFYTGLPRVQGIVHGVPQHAKNPAYQYHFTK